MASISAKELNIKESILGMLRQKDFNSSGTIHSSDFQATVDYFGLTISHPIVQSVLINCSIDPNGNINYSTLEAALLRERNILNMAPKKANSQLSSKSAVSVPWSANEFHNQFVNSEKQIKLLQSHRKDVQDAYQQFVNNAINENAFQAAITVYICVIL